MGRAEAHEDHGIHMAIATAGRARAERTAAMTGRPDEPNRWKIGSFRVTVDTDNENRGSVAFLATGETSQSISTGRMRRRWGDIGIRIAQKREPGHQLIVRGREGHTVGMTGWPMRKLRPGVVTKETVHIDTVDSSPMMAPAQASSGGVARQ